MIGVTVASNLSSVFLQGVFGGLGIAIGLYMGLGRSDWRLGQAMPAGLTPCAQRCRRFWAFCRCSWASAVAVSVFPLMSLYNTAIHRAVATAAGFGVIIAVPSVLGFLFLTIAADHRPPLTIGAVNLPAFFTVIAMTLITTPMGVKLAHAMDPKPLKRVFAVFLTLVALNMLRKALGW